MQAPATVSIVTKFRTFTSSVHASEYEVGGSLYFATVADAEAAKALFPKNLKLHAVRITSTAPDGQQQEHGTLSFRARISADGVNGGRNETGIKRYRSFRKHLEALGYSVPFQPVAGGYHGLTEAELEARIA